MHHEIKLRVYYEDTDAGGIVYHASYIRFAERGRTEFLRSVGYDHVQRFKDTGTGFAIVSLQADYRAPARLDDLLTVRTSISRMGGASMEMKQDIYRDDQLLVELKVTAVCIDSNLKAVRLPQELRDIHEPRST